jgi:hypothetical protein
MRSASNHGNPPRLGLRRDLVILIFTFRTAPAGEARAGSQMPKELLGE